MKDWTQIPKQTLLVEDGKIGDCWRCCIAALLNLPAESVPHFLEGINGEYNNNCDEDTQQWLNERGYAFVYVNGHNNIRYPRYSNYAIDLALISCGPTERSRELGEHHAVVTINNEVVYDPHPSEAGLTAIIEQYLVFKI